MSVDLYQLDSIDDDDLVVEALDGYMDELMAEFVETPECDRYLAAYPQMEEYLGNWIYHLLYYGYTYQSVTLPRMKLGDVEEIIRQLFPRKIVLTDPTDANYTIPELTAFWQFLQRVYQHPHAAKIVKFLEKIESEFPRMMNDSSNFGIGKSFVTEGIAAGFDMTSDRGLAEYQQQYNNKISSSSLPSFDELIDNIGAETENEFRDFISALMGKVTLDREPGQKASSALDALKLFRRELQAMMWEDETEEIPSLSPQAIALLQQQSISITAPGRILHDFQVLLDAIGYNGTIVTNTLHSLPMNSLVNLNQSFQKPIQIDLKRPIQQSYPAIDGLYLILRSSGLGEICQRGGKYLLVLNPQKLELWQSFNPTERYFMLLEAWLIRSNSQILGERSNLFSNEGLKCWEYWRMIPDGGLQYPNYDEQKMLSYCPGLHHLALLDLFGFIKLVTLKPDSGKGWRIKQVKKLPFGDAIMTAAYGAFVSGGMYWKSEENPDLPFNELQLAFQPYFPEWQQTF